MIVISSEEEERLINFRREIHSHPELSTEEVQTQRRIREFLAEYEPDELCEIGKTGIYASYKGEKEGPRILLRADTDALPIQEVNQFDYRSTTDGVAHKCGHDGHTAILAGVAALLKENRPARGEVILLFQPAEEIGMGARQVLEDEHFEKIAPDFVFALHNVPSYPLHKVVVKEGPFTPSVVSLALKIHGKTAHAAEPELGINPVDFIADYIRAVRPLINNNPADENFALITPTHGVFGEEWAYGTAAGEGELRLTIRTWYLRILKQLQDECLAIAEQIAEQYGIRLEHEWLQEFETNKNHQDAVEMIRSAASDMEMELENRKYPFKWGEDFGRFTQQFKGAMFGLGAGVDCPALHNPDYDFPDELIKSGSAIFYHICRQILQ